MERLRKRADFLAAAKGAKAPMAGFVLQARQRDGEPPERAVARFGFTVSRKVGNAVQRNRVRRRLREIVRLAAAGQARPGHDYVLVGRAAALSLPFARLMDDLEGAFRRVHGRRARPISTPTDREDSGAAQAAGTSSRTSGQ